MVRQRCHGNFIWKNVMQLENETADHDQRPTQADAELVALREKVFVLKQYLILCGIVVALVCAISVTILLQSK